MKLIGLTILQGKRHKIHLPGILKLDSIRFRLFVRLAMFLTYLQCLTTIPGRLLNSLWKWGHFDRAKSTLKMLLASWFFVCFFKRFRFFWCCKFEVCSIKGYKVTGHQTLRMIQPRAFSNAGKVVRVWPGPRGRLFLETYNFDSL